MMALLIEHGADLTIRNNEGKTAAEARRTGGASAGDGKLKRR
jgi:hypothetical protein